MPSETTATTSTSSFRRRRSRNRSRAGTREGGFRRKRRGLGSLDADSSLKQRAKFISGARKRFEGLDERERTSRISKLRDKLGGEGANTARLSAKISALRSKPVRGALREEFGSDFRSELRGPITGYEGKRNLRDYRTDLSRISRLEGLGTGASAEQQAKLAALRTKTQGATESVAALRAKRRAAREKALGKRYGRFYGA